MIDGLTPWLILSPAGMEWLGLARSEAHAWWIALGFPDASEVAERKAQGWRVLPASVTWQEEPAR